MADARYGVIHEIGDMGLGFNEVSNKDQKTIKESQKPKEEVKNKPK